MCSISDKLKLCTCDPNNKDLEDLWVLYRYVDGKKEITVGETMMPAFIEKDTDKINEALLLDMLNEKEVFDKPVDLIDHDRLQLSFSMPDGSMLNYGFIFNKGKWSACTFDYFEWLIDHDEIKEGKINNPF